MAWSRAWSLIAVVVLVVAVAAVLVVAAVLLAQPAVATQLESRAAIELWYGLSTKQPFIMA